MQLCDSSLRRGIRERADAVQLQFFELGADGKMHKIEHSMLPGGREELGEGNREFLLPQQGWTIAMRASKSKKVLHKFTWNGEEFVEQK